MNSDFRLGIDQIRKFLPHRAPFLLVDRILEIQPVGDQRTIGGPDKVGTKVVGVKCVSFNEPQFQGHFPNYSILPGVYILECMAQVSSFSVYPALADDLERMTKQFQCILVGVDGARFRRPVVPGDVMRVETVVTKCRSSLWVFDCSAMVDGQKVAEAQLIANLSEVQAEASVQKGTS